VCECVRARDGCERKTINRPIRTHEKCAAKKSTPQILSTVFRRFNNSRIIEIGLTRRLGVIICPRWSFRRVRRTGRVPRRSRASAARGRTRLCDALGEARKKLARASVLVRNVKLCV
jgi:hypothetical protein